MRQGTPIAPGDPPDGAASGSRARLQIQELVRVLGARRRVILTTIVAITATVLVLTLLETPQYEATATIQIEQTGPEILSFKDILSADRTYQGSWKFYQTQYKLLRSPAVLELAARDLDLPSRPDFARRRPSPIARMRDWVRELLPAPQGAPADPVEQQAAFLGSRLTVSPVRDSQLVELSFVHGNPTLARDAANAVARAYVQFNLNSRSATTLAATDFLTKEVARVQQEIEGLQRQLQEYALSKDILALSDGDSDISETALSDLNRRQIEARSRLALAEARRNSIRGAEPNALTEVVNSPLIAKLKEQYSEIQRRYSQLAERFKDDWPPLRELRNEMEQAAGRLEQEAVAIAHQVRLVADADHARALGEMQKLLAEVERQKGEVQRTKRDAIEYASMRAEIATKRSILAGLVARQTETQTSERLTNTGSSNVRLVDVAKLPKAPARPNKVTNLALALLVGLVVGVALAFALDHMDNTIQSGEDIARLTGLAVLSHVPQYAPLRAASAEADPVRREDRPLDLASHFDPRCSFSEAFKSLRTSLLLSSSDPPRTLMITSCQPKDGKSTVSANLAIVLAQLGGRVLLVDADLRLPRLHHVLRVPNTVGLSSYLSGMSTLDQAVVETDVKGLHFLSSGPIPPNPSELLGSSRLPTLLTPTTGAHGYDWVVFDSSPLLSVSDAFILASRVDATILVVRAGETTRESVTHAINRVRQGRSRVVGVVFNGVSRGAGEYYYGRYWDEKTGDVVREKSERVTVPSDKPSRSRLKRWAGRG